MNKPVHSLILIIFSALFFFMLQFNGELYAYSSADEYLKHAESSGGCVTASCHEQLAVGNTSFQHAPVINGECEKCHNTAYPDTTDTGQSADSTCSVCHGQFDLRVSSSSYVHGPVKNGDCISCHDPHGSDYRYLLKGPSAELCSVCHNLKGLYRGDSIHKPVQDGNCSICHDAHASNYRARLTDTGANLCLSCHDEMVEGMMKDNVHEPLIRSGCTDCHDPHSGTDSLRLKKKSDQLCFSCHEAKRDEISQYDVKHKPASEGSCVSCHSPHYSDHKYLLLDKVDAICYKCHKDKSEWKKRRFQHGPVAQGNCSACHNPHGSDNAFILRLSFPHKFYTAYMQGTYDLCFNCHKEALVTSKRTTTITNFRNGETNLHNLHVNRKKGRTCSACHDIHASDQYDHLREEFMFGNASIPLYYYKSKTGGRCIPGCHKERAYDRIDMIDNNN